ncbi:hypothetical protein N5C80_26625 [Pseudomonas nicosulfuronedens]|uniref:hypothetical protein n=1 Tax=Pseudomonas nicosulfuronedens TaxID=2571105 RepID=UPI00244ABE3B|nr:hypothetical protein [Pseudomonas nicosulfuronedens]MDH1012323.1 hypothetical protein [Pseudomonas nicosulfuronedens]MDH2030492.1 hypothetical protein [Pseudomonas nicosulfuronedens]
MKPVHHAGRAPAPTTPFSLYGSFNYGIQNVAAEDVIDDLLSRVEQERDPDKKLFQAQRTIGALMALLAVNIADKNKTALNRGVFARLALLTGETPNHLVAMAGVAR